MKRAWRRIGSILLAVCMAITMLPMTAFAADSTVSTEAALVAALEATTASTVTLGGDITLSTKDIKMGANHTLNTNGKTLTTTNQKTILLNGHNLTVNGNGTVDIKSGANYGIRNEGVGQPSAARDATLILENVTVNLGTQEARSDISDVNITVGSGAVLNTPSVPGAINWITIGYLQTLSINSGGTVNLGVDIAASNSGSIHINGGALIFKEGGKISVTKTLKMTDGNLIPAAGSSIRIYSGLKVEGMGPWFSDRGTDCTSEDVTVGSGTPSQDGLAGGTYFYNPSSGKFELHVITFTQSMSGINNKFIQGADASMYVTASASNGAEIRYQWGIRQEGLSGPFTDIPGETNPSFSIPTDQTGSCFYSCTLSADGCVTVVIQQVRVTVNEDPTPPGLSNGSAVRTSDTAATIAFTTDKGGTAYYTAVASGAAQPDASGINNSLGSVSAGDVSGLPVTLTEGAKDLYVVVKGSAGTTSVPLKIPVEAYVLKYSAEDIAVINAIIQTNGLNWTPANPADDVTVPGDWTSVTWSDGKTGKRRVIGLVLDDKSMTGALDVSGLTVLQTLRCSNNQLAALNVSGLAGLQTLNCSDNQLETLNVSGLTALQTLYCFNNQLETLNVSGLTALKTLNCLDNQLETLNVGGLTALQTLNCSDNQLTTLDVSGLTKLTTLNCSGNKLTTLDVSKLTVLQTLYCANNQLASLDVSKVTGLQDLNCSNNPLTTLDVSKLTVLRDLYCANNQLASLDVSKVTGLRDLNCAGNRLASLDVSKLQLMRLNCSGNQLTGLALNLSEDCEYIDVSNNYMEDETAVTSNVSIEWDGEEFIFSPQFVAVTNITDVPDDAIAGMPLTLTGTVFPEGATNQTIGWSIKNAGDTGATINSGNKLSTTAAGNVIVTATITNGAKMSMPYTQDFTIAVRVVSVYSISPDTEDYIFPAAAENYGAQEAKTVEITNTGNQPTGALTIELSGADSDSFTLSESSIDDIAAGSDTTFTVTPKAGLSAKTYTAIVTVSGGNGITASLNVSFTVTPVVPVPSSNANLASLTVSEGTLSPAFDPDITSYAVSVSHDVAGITIGTTAVSGIISGGHMHALNVGVNTIPVVVTAEDGVTTKTYTITVTRAASSGGDNNGGGGNGGGGASATTPPAEQPKTETTTSGNTATATTTVTAASNNSVTATAAVTQAQVSEAVAKAAEAAAKQGNGTTAVVEIKVTAPANAKTIETSIPKAAMDLAADGKTAALTVSTPVASLSFDAAALSTIAGEAAGAVTITASRVEASSLSAETQQLIGDRPVFNFSVTSGGQTISQFGGSVSVSVPYTPKAGEGLNAIVIYYINGEGKPEVVSNCSYDPATGTISFKTSHFSKYAVGYNKVTFQDVAENAWYGKAVGFIAARGITTGTSDGTFSPNAKLTRGQFLVMLMKAYGIAPDTNSANNFADAGSTYYTGYLAAAKRLGITAGVGDNKFAPTKEITRQEMFTLLYNALKTIGELPEGNTGKSLSAFSDAGQIASWSKDAMTLMVKTGTVSGSNGTLAPGETTTRAQMAQVLYNLMSE